MSLTLGVQQWNCGNNIIGILGPQTSAVTLEIASLGRLLSVPLISYLSSAVTLCQRDNFPNFFRTVPSDKHQALAIVALLKRFQWNYASFVHSDSVYGTTGYELVKQAVEKTNDICLADPITIYNKQFKNEDYIRVVRTLVKGKNETLLQGKLRVKKIAHIYFNLQIKSDQTERLLNKPYVNEVTLTGQNPPLKYCQPLELLTQLEKDIDLSMLKIWGL